MIKLSPRFLSVLTRSGQLKIILFAWNNQGRLFYFRNLPFNALVIRLANYMVEQTENRSNLFHKVFIDPVPQMVR